MVKRSEMSTKIFRFSSSILSIRPRVRVLDQRHLSLRIRDPKVRPEPGARRPQVQQHVQHHDVQQVNTTGSFDTVLQRSTTALKVPEFLTM